MASSGNYKKHDIPDEAAFIPSSHAPPRPRQTKEQMVGEIAKLIKMQG
jgi:hypothetical protein